MNKQTIGTNAGTIWKLLSGRTKWSVESIHQATALPIEEIYLALGWLARENKIEMTTINDTAYFYLSLEPYF